MKNFLQKCLLAVSLPLVLTACDASQPTVTYYLEHPRLLDKQLQLCMARTDSEESAKCKTAIDAQGLLRIYLQSEQTNPEQFGQRIMDTEIECADLQAKMADKNGSELQQLYESKQQELRILLAVAGLNSPE